ncbi:MAG: helix-turn-helix domain-containing protein [Sulfurimicrobium sp.]|nr:helix-turn-helix domain-containing protein [Sulfurimicrobium sp.]
MIPMEERTVMIHSADELGAMLRMLRKESDLTLRDAVGLCNVSLPFLNQVEQGKSTAQIGKVLDVCKRFGIEIVFKLPGLK